MTAERHTTQDKILYGGDYNPDQWPRQVWDEDYEAFEHAHIDTVTLGVFAWSLVQPAEDTFDFGLMDEIVERASRSGKRIVMATATGAMPPWLAHEHPEVTRTDFDGRRHVYGGRHNHCPSSPVFRQLSRQLAGRFAERYSTVDGLVAWHIGNEYSGACYCELCAAQFRLWLEARYGSVDRLNDAWNGAFWSHLFTDFEQVQPPTALSEHWNGPRATAFQGITLDYRRFMTDALLENYRNEKRAIREIDENTPITTNFMGMFEGVDYHRWADDLDFACWDNYPRGDRVPQRMALAHDLTRGLKAGSPFWVMEQTPTVTANRDVNPLKRPGVMRLWSWQSVAHGADAVLFFQMRQSKGASEKYHGAVLDHAGRTDSRAFREVAELGKDFTDVGRSLLGSRVPARTAMIFDWDSWWLVETTDGINRHVEYREVFLDYYTALWEAGVQVDVVPTTADLSRYDVVVAPLLHLVKGDTADRLKSVVESGGTVVTTFWSARSDEDGNAFLADAPGPLRELLGVRVEETDSAAPGDTNPVALRDQESASPAAHSEGALVMDILVPEGADVVGTYGREFYAGRAAVTRHMVDGGEAWYVGTRLDAVGLRWILDRVSDRHDLRGPYAEDPQIEYSVRRSDEHVFSFVLNHAEERTVASLHASGVDLISGRELRKGQRLDLGPSELLVLQEASVD